MSLAPPSPLAEYAAMLWRRKATILAITLALTTPAFVLSWLQTPEYQASSALALSAPVVTSDQTVKSAELSDTEMTTQAAIMKGDAVSTAAAARGAQSAVSTSLTTKSNIMTISALGSSPEAAAQSTNAYADAYIQLRTEQQRSSYDEAIKQLDARISGLRQQLQEVAGADTTSVGQLASLETQQSRIQLQQSLAATSTTVVVRAVPPAAPSTPQILRNTLVGLVLGLALGVAVAILSESSRRRRIVGASATQNGAMEATASGSEPTDTVETTVRTQPTTNSGNEAPRQYVAFDHSGPTVANNHYGGPPRPPATRTGGAGIGPSPRPR